MTIAARHVDITTQDIVCDNGMPAFLAYPAGAGSFPTVILMHERYGLVKHTRDQAMRKARNLEIVANSSASAPRRNAISARASASGVPVSSSSRNRAKAAASAKVSSCAGLPPAAWTARASATRKGPRKPLPRSSSAVSTLRLA